MNLSDISLNLKEMISTAVKTPTREDYTLLMQVYESSDWKRANLSLSTNSWGAYEHETCVSAHDNFTLAPLANFKEICFKIISLREFYSAQDIDDQKLEMIKTYFQRR